MNQSARPLFADGRLILNTAAGGLKLLAVDPRGHGDVTDTNILWTYGKMVPTRSSQLLIGDLLFMVNDAGVASCLNAQTVKQLWHERFGGDYSASPIYADGRIYFFSEDGRSPVIEPAATYKLLAENKLGDGFMASPAVVGRALILRSRSHLYRIEKPAPSAR
jgi:outer membrane protein assembly factor BamB